MHSQYSQEKSAHENYKTLQILHICAPE